MSASIFFSTIFLLYSTLSDFWSDLITCFVPDVIFACFSCIFYWAVSFRLSMYLFLSYYILISVSYSLGQTLIISYLSCSKSSFWFLSIQQKILSKFWSLKPFDFKQLCFTQNCVLYSRPLCMFLKASLWLIYLICIFYLLLLVNAPGPRSGSESLSSARSPTSPSG